MGMANEKAGFAKHNEASFSRLGQISCTYNGSNA
jgi:hypothetical protein